MRRPAPAAGPVAEVVAGRAVCRIVTTGIEVRIRLTPKSSADRIEGIIETPDGPALTMRVRAVPSEGEANAAAQRVLAGWLGLAKSCVALTSGHKSRIKTLTVEGDGPALMAVLGSRLARDP
jgi:uncharacterized protein YggU (UPF0235/DUF167 family)